MNFCVALSKTPEGHSLAGDANAVIWPVEGYGEYAVVRADNYGWGTGYEGATLDNNWDWATFKEEMDGASVLLAVTNNGTTVDIVATITSKTGVVRTQSYKGIAVDGDVYVSLLCEGAYLLVD